MAVAGLFSALPLPLIASRRALLPFPTNSPCHSVPRSSLVPSSCSFPWEKAGLVPGTLLFEQSQFKFSNPPTQPLPCPSVPKHSHLWDLVPEANVLGLYEEGQIIPILCRAARLLLKQLHISGTMPGWGVDHSRASAAPKGNHPQRKIRHKMPARNQSCGMPLLTASSTAVDRNKPAQLSLWSWRWAMGRQDVCGWMRGKDFFLCENIQFHH